MAPLTKACLSRALSHICFISRMFFNYSHTIKKPDEYPNSLQNSSLFITCSILIVIKRQTATRSSVCGQTRAGSVIWSLYLLQICKCESRWSVPLFIIYIGRKLMFCVRIQFLSVRIWYLHEMKRWSIVFLFYF